MNSAKIQNDCNHQLSCSGMSFLEFKLNIHPCYCSKVVLNTESISLCLLQKESHTCLKYIA